MPLRRNVLDLLSDYQIFWEEYNLGKGKWKNPEPSNLISMLMLEYPAATKRVPV
jgi:hypothetical protein